VACGASLFNGRGGIRTHGTLARTHTFQACALNHSATRPTALLRLGRPGNNDALARATASNAPSRSLELLYGQGEIRTHDTLTGTPVFETGAFNHSATCPTFTTAL
jgi:hypothetical protein